MNEQKPEKIEKPEELLRAEKLIDDAKASEAHELLDNFEKKEGLTLQDKVTSHLLRADLLHQQGRYDEVVTLAEQTYKESLGLGKNLQSVDCFIYMADALFFLVKPEKLHDIIKQGEELLKALPQELSADYKQREAYLAFLKGKYYGITGEMNLALNSFKQAQDLAEKTDFKRLKLGILGFFAIMAKNKGDLDLALVYLKKSLAIAKESKKKWSIAIIHMILGDGSSQQSN